jgi:hypothetical protein
MQTFSRRATVHMPKSSGTSLVNEPRRSQSRLIAILTWYSVIGHESRDGAVLSVRSGPLQVT